MSRCRNGSPPVKEYSFTPSPTDSSSSLSMSETSSIPKEWLWGLQLMKQWAQARLHTVPVTWNHNSSRCARGTTGAGASRMGSGTAMRSALPVQVEVGLAGDQGERVAHLLEAVPQ